MRIRLFPLFVLLVFPSLSLAQTGPGIDGDLSLEEAIHLGLTGNPSLAARRSGLSAAGAGVLLAESVGWPKVTTEALWRRSNNQVLVFGDKLTAGEFTAEDFQLDRLNDPGALSHGTLAIGVELPLDVSGRISSEVSRARSERGSMEAGLRAAETDLVARITEAYYGISLAQAAVGVAESALSSARGHEAMAQARFEEGSALKSDALRARVERLARERDLERKQADLELARARLRRLLGVEEETGVDPVTPLEPPQEDLGQLKSWIQEGLAERPDLEAARRSVEAARADVQAARAAYAPEVAGNARYERNMNGFDSGEGSLLVGVAIRWAAFDRGRSSRVDLAQARAETSEAQCRSLEDGVRLEVEQAYRDAGVAEHNLETAREAARAAEEVRRIRSERYAAGLLTLTDLLDAETASVAARLAEISALFESVVGRVRLQRSSGLLEVPRP